MEIEAKHLHDLAFSAHRGTFEVSMDANKEFGGTDSGMNPKELLLSSLAGCTGMDVVSILKKMKASFATFTIKVAAEKSTEEPIVFTKIHIDYIFKGLQDRTKAEKAVTLSQEKYCGISAMLRKAAEVTWSITHIN